MSASPKQWSLQQRHGATPAAAVAAGAATVDLCLSSDMEQAEADPPFSPPTIFIDHAQDGDSKMPALKKPRSHEKYQQEQDDFLVAQSLQQMLVTKSTAKPKEDTTQDHRFALDLERKFQQEEQEAEARKKAESEQMNSTSTGQAVSLVEDLLGWLDGKNAAADGFDPVSRDSMVPMAENFFALKETFEKEGRPMFVDLGVHYTKSSSLNSIKDNGLLTRADQASTGSTGASHSGEAYGPGMYTASDPVSSQSYGDVGLILLRLAGNVTQDRYHRRSESSSNTADTVSVPGYGWMVLRKSAQCIPLIQFQRDCIHNTDQVVTLMRALQNEFVDPKFNGGNLTDVSTKFNLGGDMLSRLGGLAPFSAAAFGAAPPPPLPSLPPLPPPPSFFFGGSNPPPLSTAPSSFFGQSAVPHRTVPSTTTHPPASAPPPAARTGSARSSAAMFFGTTSSTSLSASFGFAGPPPRAAAASTATTSFTFGAPPSARKDAAPETIQYTAPQSLSLGPSCMKHKTALSQSQCSICLVGIDAGDQAASLLCGHVFHEDCINGSLKHSQKCPDCRRFVGRPAGKMPSGKMIVSEDKYLDCQGFPSGTGTFVIEYNIPPGLQMQYHDSPGVPHSGAYRTAYVPNTVEGRNVLKRLKFAFRHGLTFTVGTSMTSGAPNQVTWSSIHHKTSFSGGQACHGFPDDNYIRNVNAELDTAGVPSAQNL